MGANNTVTRPREHDDRCIGCGERFAFARPTNSSRHVCEECQDAEDRGEREEVPWPSATSR